MPGKSRSNFSSPPSSPKGAGANEYNSPDASDYTALLSGGSPLSSAVEPAFVTPNERRRSSLGLGRRRSSAFDSDKADSPHPNELEKYFHERLQEQITKHLVETRKLEKENERLKSQATDPEYILDLEKSNDELWKEKEALQEQIENFKTENRKLKDDIAWQQREHEHALQESRQHRAGTKSLTVGEREELIAKCAGLRDQLDEARNQNEVFYEECMTLQKQNEELKAQNTVGGISNKLKLIKINKEEALRDEEYISVRNDLARLHEELDQVFEGKMRQEGPTVFEPTDFMAQLDESRGIIENLKERLRKQQDHIEELNLERSARGISKAKAELGKDATLSSTPSLADEIPPYRIQFETQIKKLEEQLQMKRVENERLMHQVALLQDAPAENEPDKRNKAQTKGEKPLIFRKLDEIGKPVEQDTQHTGLGDKISKSAPEAQPPHARLDDKVFKPTPDTQPEHEESGGKVSNPIPEAQSQHARLDNKVSKSIAEAQPKHARLDDKVSKPVAEVQLQHARPDNKVSNPVAEAQPQHARLDNKVLKPTPETQSQRTRLDDKVTKPTSKSQPQYAKPDEKASKPTNQGTRHAKSDKRASKPIPEAQSKNIQSATRPQKEAVTDTDDTSNEPQPQVHFQESLWNNLCGGRENDEDLVLSSFSSSSKTSKTSVPSASPFRDNTQIDPKLLINSPPLLGRFWTDFLWAICASSEYWAQVEVGDRYMWAKARGPWWWSLIVQLLTWMLLLGLMVAYWCIMAASAERELWLDANEITVKKYWDTAVWGAERDILWRLCYGLGLV